jgi:3-phosphoshikimate 1-carboxyvinyltransferase
MRALISKSDISGRLTAPSSKSYTLRGLMCGALARGDSEVIDPLTSDDTEAAIEVLGKVGVSVDRQQKRWLVAGGRFHQSETDLHCRESAATLRFMTAIATLLPGKHRLKAGESLSGRPIAPLLGALRQAGATCSAEDGLPPIIVNGGGLRGGLTELPGDISSQFVSALLLAAPLTAEGMNVRLTTPLESAPYVLMTLDSMQWFGITVAFSEELDSFDVLRRPYTPSRYRVEGDWSSASYPLALGALAGEVTVDNVSPESLQGDRVILDFLQEMGASAIVSENTVTTGKSRLSAIRTDLSDCTDLLPTVAVLAAAAEGVSHLTGVRRARIKESNRVAAVREGLRNMDIAVTEEEDRMTITGGKPTGAVIDSKNDHRIAMAFSLLGAVVGDTVIEGAECVSKTYPRFWEELKSLGCRVTIDG